MIVIGVCSFLHTHKWINNQYNRNMNTSFEEHCFCTHLQLKLPESVLYLPHSPTSHKLLNNISNFQTISTSIYHHSHLLVLALHPACTTVLSSPASVETASLCTLSPWRPVHSVTARSSCSVERWMSDVGWWCADSLDEEVLLGLSSNTGKKGGDHNREYREGDC